ncbi:UxaA family hydrolase [Castellaniella sp.]|uniref:UxaA family hydrolase n=1 Tax=Castellaniella sp. TaxID=1955812 RepID=UPI0035672C45
MKPLFKGLHGFRRADGTLGLRNRVIVLAAADNVNPLARAIAAAVPGSTFIPATFGRGQLGADLEVTLRTQANLACHPNVYGALIVSFEPASSERIAERTKGPGRRVHELSLLQAGGHAAALASGTATVSRMVEHAASQKAEPMSASELVIGLECGGSDATSGLVSNPAVGLVSDVLIAAGATTVYSEPVELIGCEPMLDARSSPDVSAAIRQSIARYRQIALDAGVDLVGINPTADNLAGGLTTIEEKSMGALAKTGTAPIQGVLEYGARPAHPGLWLMDAPAGAVENLTALSAGGCHAILFSSGSVNPSGSAVAPTLKVCANPLSCRSMAEHIDVDLSAVLLGQASMDWAKEELLINLDTVLKGGDTKADILGYTETRISRFGLSV